MSGSRIIGRRIRAAAAGVACVLASATLLAHDVVVEQRVEMTMQPRGDRLIVQLHIPASAVADAKLPRLPGGALDPTTIEQRLQIVAADTARNLDVRQADSPLAPPQIIARLSADGASIDVDLSYPMGAGTADLSARLNAFQGTPLQPVRTTVRYLPQEGTPQIVSVIGPATRVQFDPTLLEALQQFAARALTSVLSLGDHILFLVCLLVPLRRASTAAALLGGMIGGQAIAIVACLVLPAGGADGVPLSALIAASALVVATAQNVVNARLALVGGLAAAFGVLNGVAFGSAFAITQQFAGAHQGVALVAFLLVLLGGQMWLGAVIWATRAWLDARGVPERVLTIGASALIAHSAVHEVFARSRLVSDLGWFDTDHLLVLLAVAWTVVMLAIAGIEAFRHGRATDRSGRIAESPQA